MWISRDKLRFIDYTERDFDSIKEGLRNYIKLYFPGEIRSFAEGTVADIFLNLNAYVSDVLHYYIDKQFSELFLDRAIETKNVYGIAKNLGYSIKGYKSSVVDVNISVDLPATGSNLATYKFVLPKYSQFSAGNILFETQENITFDGTITGKNISQTPIYNEREDFTYTRLTLSNIRMLSGVTKKFNTNVDDLDYFPTIIIPEQKISTITSVVDQEGNEYEQVKNLAQQAKYVASNNNSTDADLVPYVLNVKRVPYRYVVDLLSDGHMRLTFGNSEGADRNSAYIPTFSEFNDDNRISGKFDNFNPSDVTINNLTRTNTLGVRPNSQITVTYRVSGGLSDNVGSNTISIPINLDPQWYSPSYISDQAKSKITRSIRCVNTLPSAGGRATEGIDSIRLNASLHFSAQDRVVTVEDYYTRIMSMPPEYGKFEKIAIKRGYNRNDDLIRDLRREVQDYFQFTKRNRKEFDKIDNIRDIYEQKQNYDEFFNATSKNEEDFQRGINGIFESIDKQNDDIILYVLAMNNKGDLIKATSTLKDNAKTYLKRFTPVSTTIKFEDANIINLQLHYQVKIDFNSFESDGVLNECYDVLRKELKTANMQIGRDIIKTKLIDILHGVNGVEAVPMLEFTLMNYDQGDGRVYSTDVILPSIASLYSYNASIIACPTNSIFEIKYPKYDIIGSVT